MNSGSLVSVLKKTVTRWMIAGTIAALVLSAFIAWVNLRLSAQREASLQVQALAQSFRSAILGGDVKYSEIRMRASFALGSNDVAKVLNPDGGTLYAEPFVRNTWDVREPLQWSGPLRLIAIEPIFFDANRTSLFGYLAIERSVQMDWVLLLMIFGSLMSGQLTFFFLYRMSVVRMGEHLSRELSSLKRGIESNSTEGATSIAELNAIHQVFSRVQSEIGDLERLGRQGKDMARVAHDIRSPLSALSIGLKSLQEIPQPTRELLDAAYVRMESIAADILKNGATAAKRTPLADVAKMADDLMAEKSLEHAALGLHWGIEADESVRSSKNSISAPCATLIRSLSNLLNNAAEASPRGALVRLIMKEEQGRLVFAVLDQGPGIPVDVMPAFLNGGVSSKEGGHGLGLSGARRFAEAHGGTLQLLNLENGLEVILTLSTVPASLQAGRIGG